MSSAGKPVLNQHYDEAVDLSDDDLDESIDTNANSASVLASPPSAARQKKGSAHGGHSNQVDSPPNAGDSMDGRGEYASDTEISGFNAGGANGGVGGANAGQHSEVNSTEQQHQYQQHQQQQLQGGGQGHNGGSGGGAQVVANAGIVGIPPKKSAYNPQAYAELRVPDEIRELFGLITRFSPAPIEIETRIKPFIPDFCPATGEVDPFLKPFRPPPPSASASSGPNGSKSKLRTPGTPLPPPPVGEEETDLGLKVLDEPALNQSDPTVLELQLRAHTKRALLAAGGSGSADGAMLVRALEQADKNPKEITKWIASITALHKSKPAPQVRHTRPMPDAEALMQAWPAKFESVLSQIPLPAPDIDMSTEEYAKFCCALLDVPVWSPPGSALVQSLHALFSLYCDFRSNAHFANLAGGDGEGGNGGVSSGAGFGRGANGNGNGHQDLHSTSHTAKELDSMGL